jgi:hypothetical protein
MPVHVYRMYEEFCSASELKSRARSQRLRGLPRKPKDDDGDEPFAPLVDDGLALMDSPQKKIGPVLDVWPKDLRFRTSVTSTTCDVLSNPNAFICTAKFKEGVSRICGTDVEWLPVFVEPFGEMYVFHPIRSVPLGPAAKHTGGVSKNITWIEKYDFETPSPLPPCFLISQPPDSPAGRGGYACAGVYITEVLRSKMWSYRGVDFSLVFECA